MKARITLTLSLLVLLIFPILSYDVVLYQKGFACISKTATFQVTSGYQNLIYTDIPETVQPGSIVLTMPDDIEILDQTYIPKITNMEDYLELNSNQVIDVYTVSGDKFRGKLLFWDRTFVTIIDQSRNEMNLINMEDISNIGSGLNHRDSEINWNITSSKDKTVKAELTCIANGINWEPIYNATWDSENKIVTLSSNILINNTTDYFFDDVNVDFFAGDINMINSPMRAKREYATDYDDSSTPGYSVVSDYYIYPHPQTVDIPPNNQKTVIFLQDREVVADQRYEYKTFTEKISSSLNIRNSNATGLGLPLPNGSVKIYSYNNGTKIFIGQDNIANTAIDEEFSITSGYAFDITGETIIEDQRKESRKATEKDILVRIVNRSIQTATISVIHNLFGYWKISNNTVPYHKRKSNEIEFTSNINPGETIEIKWTERIEY